MWMNKTFWMEGGETFYPSASQLFAEVRSRLEMEQDRISSPTEWCSHPALGDTLLLVFTTPGSRLSASAAAHLSSVLRSPFVLLVHVEVHLLIRETEFPWCWRGLCPCRPISPTSSASLHSSPATRCFQTISTRTKSECYRPSVSKPTQETIPIISEQ